MNQMTESDPIRLIKGYQADPEQRASFNRLATSVFGLDFEDWYQLGCWNENYIPYSIFRQGEVIANVSVSPMVFLDDNRPARLLQLGTVMTRVSERGKGWTRLLLDEVRRDFGGQTDGWFLYANDSVVGLYPKFGFRPHTEQEFYKTVTNQGTARVHSLPLQSDADQARLVEAIRASAIQHRMWLQDPVPLLLFYLTKFMPESVYYLKEQNAWVIAEIQGDTLILHEVFGPDPVNLHQVIQGFGGGIREAVLGFAPLDPKGFSVRPLIQDDTTCFVQGAWFEHPVDRTVGRIPGLART